MKNTTRQINTIVGLEDIKDYYWITKCGKIVSTYRGMRIIKLSTTSNGYSRISLMNDKGKKKMFLAHRLVALAYIDNIENKDQVNHINEVKADNYISNLEWNTPKENCNHGTRNEKVANLISGSKNYKSKPVEYYETNSTRNHLFKRTCKRQDWNFDDFEKVFDKWHIDSEGIRNRKYFYKKINMED